MGVIVKCCPASDAATITAATGQDAVLTIPVGVLPGARVHITQIWASNEPSDNTPKILTITTEGGTTIWEEYTETIPNITRYFNSPLRGPIGEDLIIEFEGHPGSNATLSVTYFVSV